MIILHFDLHSQFKYMNYFIYTSHHFIFNHSGLTKTSFKMCIFFFFFSEDNVNKGRKNICEATREYCFSDETNKAEYSRSLSRIVETEKHALGTSSVF